jgi:hypothetical protein
MRNSDSATEEIPIPTTADILKWADEDLERLISIYSNPHYHKHTRFRCSGICTESILAREIIRLRRNYES